MPRYSWSIEEILFEEDVRKMYDLGNREEALFTSLLWLTGARPQEILQLKPTNFLVASDRISITMQTLKKKKRNTEITKHRRACAGWKARQPCAECWGDGMEKREDAGGAFRVKERTLMYRREYGFATNIYLETVANFLEGCSADARLLHYTNRWGEKLINRLGEATIQKKICPYHFRHSVMTWLARNGWSPYDIMYYKGAESLDSVMQYIHAKPQLVVLENLNRLKHQPQFIKGISVQLPPGFRNSTYSSDPQAHAQPAAQTAQPGASMAEPVKSEQKNEPQLQGQ